MDQEDREITRLIEDCLSSKKCYIQYGNLEPIHHQEDERKIIVDQMQSLLTRCVNEMIDQQKMFIQTQKQDIPREVTEKMEMIKKLDDDFKHLAREKPWAL